MKAPEKFLLALVAALALLLAGCGGGSNDNGNNGGGGNDSPPTAAQIQALATAVTATETALAALVGEATAAEITAATGRRDALQAAITTARGQGVNTADAQSVLQRATQAITAAQGVAAAAAATANMAVHRALHAAIFAPGTTTVDLGTTLDITILPATAGRFADTALMPPSGAIKLKAGDDVTALMGWSGKDYKLEQGTGSAKRTTEARIYHNQEAPKTGQAITAAHFNAVNGISGITPANVMANIIPLPTGTIGSITASDFPTRGRSRYELGKVAGTLAGVSGDFVCKVTAGCTIGYASEGFVFTASQWDFQYPKSATISVPDADYLYFGWWVHKNNEGHPLAASAFYEERGTVAHTLAELQGLGGTATYEGAAVGKYADYSRREGTPSGGHFTADAELKATFANFANDGGVTGTIDNFRLNDGATNPGWSIALNRSGFADNGAISQKVNADGTDFETGKAATVWSIGDNKGSPAGSWDATLYDAPADASNNTPPVAAGQFHATFGTDLTMVGAFGANLKDE